MKYKLWLLITALTCFSSFLLAQQPLQITVGAVRTQLAQPAVKLGVQYAPDAERLFNRDFIRIDSTKKSLFILTPEIDLQTGNNDAFSGLTIKLAGLHLLFDTTRVTGTVTPRSDRTIHVFQYALGAETSNAFQKANGLLEVGYVPMYWMHGTRTPAILKRTKLGFFLQGGYKFDIDSNSTFMLRGGQLDESKEQTDDALLRLKGTFEINTGNYWVNQRTQSGLALIGKANAWYDFLNEEIYYRIEAKARIFLGRDYFFDLGYEKGSGAPNFNQGEQFGATLTVSF
ncbi:MAG: hypothetical protein SFV22_08825 [Saprospiraceae bacterium]|nr:hypothetical protein [Saprospiraceae bacterium]